MSTTSQATACACVANESPGAADRVGQVREAGRELEHRRQRIERRLAGRKAECGDVHVAIHEAAAGDQRARRNAVAPGRAEVDDEGLRSAGVAMLGEPSQQRDRRIDLADAGVENVDAGAFEAAGALGRQRHDDEDPGRFSRHSE